MYFNQVAGQENVKKTLRHLASSAHIPHALLLAGKEGTGGLPLAIAFAQYIFCERKSSEDSCGECQSCIKVAKLVHPDLHLSFPAVPPKPGIKALSRFYIEEFREFVSQTPYGATYDWLQYINAENKQGNIPAEECREIIDRLNLKAFEGNFKIQIIWRPEYLGKEGNILLKLIEEPPDDTIIILVAEASEEILETLLSRTQLLRLQPLQLNDIAKQLIIKNDIDEKRALQIAHLSEGSYTQALRIMRYHSDDMLPPLKQWLHSIFSNDAIGMNQWVEDMAKMGREQQKNTLTYLQQLLAHAMRKTIAPRHDFPVSDDEQELINTILNYNVSIKSFELFHNSISKTIYHIERNAHSKTQLMYLSLQMQYHLKERELKAN